MHWYKTYIFSEIGKEETVLSLGCGVLQDIEGLECKEITGIDIYDPYIKHLKKAYHGDLTKRFFVGDITVIEWPYQAYDVIIATDILEHLPHDQAVSMLAKMKRWARRAIIVYTPKVFFDNVTENLDGQCDVLKKIAGDKDSKYKGLGINKHQAHQCVITQEELEGKGYHIVNNPDTGILAIWFNFEALPNPVGNLRHENRFWEFVGKSANPFEAVRGGWRREDFFARTDETVLDLFDMKLTEEDVFVDLGCGLGYVCKMVAPLVKLYIGIDYSASLLERARKINRDYRNSSFVHNDGQSIPLPDSSVDALISEQVFQHMSAPACFRYFQEIKRVLKPKGRFCLQAPKRSAYKFGLDKGQLTGFFPEEEILSIDQWYWHIVRNAKRTDTPTWIKPRK